MSCGISGFFIYYSVIKTIKYVILRNVSDEESHGLGNTLRHGKAVTSPPPLLKGGNKGEIGKAAMPPVKK